MLSLGIGARKHKSNASCLVSYRWIFGKQAREIQPDRNTVTGSGFAKVAQFQSLVRRA